MLQGQFAPVKGNYSEEFKSLVMDMLQRDPDSRPSAADLCQQRLPLVSVVSISSLIAVYIALSLSSPQFCWPCSSGGIDSHVFVGFR